MDRELGGSCGGLSKGTSGITINASLTNVGVRAQLHLRSMTRKGSQVQVLYGPPMSCLRVSGTDEPPEASRPSSADNSSSDST